MSRLTAKTRFCKKNLQKDTPEQYGNVFLLVAGVGLEPHDLRVMSPTSYRLLYPATTLSFLGQLYYYTTIIMRCQVRIYPIDKITVLFLLKFSFFTKVELFRAEYTRAPSLGRRKKPPFIMTERKDFFKSRKKNRKCLYTAPSLCYNCQKKI